MAKTLEERKAYEKRVVRLMVGIYCRDVHGSAKGKLCLECAALADYADKRVDACRRGQEKTFCANCPSPCYKPAMREQIRLVMRHSGPRMLLHHPALAMKHLACSIREKKRLKKGSQA